MTIEKRSSRNRVAKRLRKTGATKLKTNQVAKTIELSEMREPILIPKETPLYDTEMPSTFIREAAYRDAEEAENKYNQSRRNIAILLDTQAFLITISDKAIQYRDAVYFLETNHGFKRCHSEDEATKVRNILGRIFEGKDKLMYKALKEFSNEMRLKRKHAKDSELGTDVARGEALRKQLKEHSDISRTGKKYRAILNGLNWINGNQDRFQTIIRLRQNRSNDIRIAAKVNLTEEQVRRYVSNARSAGLVKGNAGNILYRTAYRDIFYPKGGYEILEQDT